MKCLPSMKCSPRSWQLVLGDVVHEMPARSDFYGMFCEMSPRKMGL